MRESSSETLRNYRQNLKDIFYAARKRTGLTQMELSQKSGVSQGNISKYENGLSIPEAPIFIVLCNSLEMPYDCLASGFIDQLRIAKPKMRKDIGGFRVPTKYANNCVFNVRGVRPWLALGEKTLGRETLRKTMKSQGIDPAYLVNMDSQLNELFLLDLKKQVTKKAKKSVSAEDLFGDDFNTYDFHGNLHHQYAISKTGIKAIDKFLQNGQYYNCSYTREIEKKTANSLSVKFSLNSALQDLSEEQLDFYREDLLTHTPKFLEKMAMYGKTDDSVIVKPINNKGLECTYQISVA